MIRRATALAILTGLIGGGAVGAVPTQTPQAWLESVYTHFKGGHMPEYEGKDVDAFFDPELAALEREHEAQIDAGQDDHDDGNDLCECQDTDHPSWKMTTTRQGPTHATSIVLFTSNGRTITYKFWLSLTNRGWRISDFQDIAAGWPKGTPHGADIIPSFKTSLTKEVQHAANQNKGSH